MRRHFKAIPFALCLFVTGFVLTSTPAMAQGFSTTATLTCPRDIGAATASILLKDSSGSSEGPYVLACTSGSSDKKAMASLFKVESALYTVTISGSSGSDGACSTEAATPTRVTCGGAFDGFKGAPHVKLVIGRTR